LSTGDRDALAPSLAALDDRAQSPHGLHVLALEPAPCPEGLEQAIGERMRLSLEREAHAGATTGVGGQLEDSKRADPVGLASAADLDDAMRGRNLGEGHVAPAEAVA